MPTIHESKSQLYSVHINPIWIWKQKPSSLPNIVDGIFFITNFNTFNTQASKYNKYNDKFFFQNLSLIYYMVMIIYTCKSNEIYNFGTLFSSNIAWLGLYLFLIKRSDWMYYKNFLFHFLRLLDIVELSICKKWIHNHPISI